MPGRPRRGKGNPSTRVRKPFEPGNLAAMRSGAYSPRVRDPWAEALTSWAREQKALAFLADESFAPSVWRWAQRTAAADLLYDELSHHQVGRRRPCPGCAVCRSLEERWIRMDRTAERAGERLGLDPHSRAELMVKLRSAGLVKSEVEHAKSLLTRMGEALGLSDYVDHGDEPVDVGVVDGESDAV
jgi:hypothetical protein